MAEKATNGHIVVASHRKWFGDQRLGTFTVSLDGSSAGKLLPDGAVDLTCDPGPHTVRIRQWWYRSEPTQVLVSADQAVSLNADIHREGNALVRMARFLFTPSKALSLTKSEL